MLEVPVTVVDEVLMGPVSTAAVVLEGTVTTAVVVLEGGVVVTLVVVGLLTVAGAVSEILNSHGGVLALLKPQRSWLPTPRGLHG